QDAGIARVRARSGARPAGSLCAAKCRTASRSRWMLARLGCLRDEEGLTGWPVSLDVDVRESNRAASLGEGLCLGVGPAVARQTRGAGPRAAFDREEPAPRGQHSARLRHAGV